MNNPDNQNPGQQQEQDRKVQPMKPNQDDDKMGQKKNEGGDFDQDDLEQDDPTKKAKKKDGENVNDLNDEDGLADDEDGSEQLH